MLNPSNRPGAVMLPFQSLPTLPTMNISMLAGVAISIRESAFIERTGRQFAEATVRIDPFDHLRLVQMPAQDQVRIIGQQPPGVYAVGELVTDGASIRFASLEADRRSLR